jgi:ATP-dependent helicase/nuclease subunit A
VDSLSKKIAAGETLENPNIPTQGEEGVQIMSIHKSKGLQFKNVFIPYCGARLSPDTDFLFFDETFGVTLNLPLHPKVVGSGESTNHNYFRYAQNADINAQDEAELRRILYVAMTRAENEIFLTTTAEAKVGFQKLLNPILENPEDGCFEIIEETGKDTPTSLSQPSSPRYKCPRFPEENSEQNHFTHVNASSEEAKALILPLLQQVPTKKPSETATAPTDSLLEELTQWGFSHDKFGTLVHLLIEVAIQNGGQIPDLDKAHGFYRLEYEKLISPIRTHKHQEKILAQAKDFATNFLKSPLCEKILSLPSEKVKTEFSFRLFLPQGERPIFVKGTFDLLAEFPDFVQVVDFKTDLLPDSSRHFSQMAIYKAAAEALFGKTAKVSLFFVRNPQGEEKIFP